MSVRASYFFTVTFTNTHGLMFPTSHRKLTRKLDCTTFSR